jgi:hypothetical protein
MVSLLYKHTTAIMLEPLVSGDIFVGFHPSALDSLGLSGLADADDRSSTVNLANTSVRLTLADVP